MESRNNSPFPWLQALISYFQSLKEIDDEIEQIRISLCGKPQFSPLALFSHLDSGNKSFLTLNDFTSFLDSQNTSFDDFKLRKMIHNFDKDNDFSLNLHEFLGLIIPRKNLGLQKSVCSMAKSSNNNKNDNAITPEMTAALKDLILREMNLVKELGQISGKIKNSRFFSTYEAFMAIVGSDRYLTKSNLYNFLKNNNVNIDDGEVTQLMFRLDTDNDDKISYGEFKEIFDHLGDEFDYFPKKEVINNDNNNNNNYKDESYSYANKENYNYNNNKKLYEKYINNDYYYNNDNDIDKDYNKKNDKDYDKDYNEKYDKDYNKKSDKDYDKKYDKDDNKKYDNNYDNNYDKNYDNNYDKKYTKKYDKNYDKNYDNNDDNNYDENYDKDYDKNQGKTYDKIYDKNYDKNFDKNYDKNYDNKNIKDFNDDNNKYKNNYNFDENEEEEKNNENRGKKTKKKVLRPAKNDNVSNILQSKEPSKNYIKKNLQEISNAKSPDMNNQNSKDSYTLNLISKYSCNNNQKGLDSDDNTDDNESEFKYDSKKNKRMKLKRKISFEKDELEDNSPDENIDENNYEKATDKYRGYNKRFLSSRNSKDNNDEYNNPKYENEKNEKCKECLLSAKNKYNTRREKNYNSNNNTSNQTKNDDKKNKYDFDYDDNSNTLFMDRNNTYAKNNEFKYESTLNEPKNGIYKRKEELLRKYLGSYTNYYGSDNYNDNGNDNDNDYNMDRERKRNDRNNYYFDSKENISSRINKDFPSQKMDNDDDDDYDNGNGKKGLKKRKEDRYFTNDSNSNSTNRNNDNQDNDNHRPIFAERFKRVKENKNNYFESSSTPLRSNPNPNQKQVFNRVPLNGDNLKQKKDLFFKLLVDYIEGDSNEEIKAMITKAANNIYFDLFEDIKKENKPGIQRDDIDKFMNENGYNVKDDEIEIIMEKMDKNKDGVIDYEEFIGEVQTKNY